jgi:dipeptide/tripeptide permease
MPISCCLSISFPSSVVSLPINGWDTESRHSGHHHHVRGLLATGISFLVGGKEIIAVYTALGVIALGTGLFKGNYSSGWAHVHNPKYEKKRDSGFSVFYMFINVGAMFAPTAAEAVVNVVMKGQHLFYDSRIPELFHKLKVAHSVPRRNKISGHRSTTGCHGHHGGPAAIWSTVCRRFGWCLSTWFRCSLCEPYRFL